MTIQDAWLAGLIEGEGCIDLKHRKGQRSAVRIRVKMTDEDVVAHVAELFGSAYYERPQPNGWQLQYETAITGKKAEAILERLTPLLGERRKAKLAELYALR